MSKIQYTIGLDEVGLGSLAYTVVVCGVRMQKEWTLDGLNDSKKLSEKNRLIMRDKIFTISNMQYCIAERDNNEIDKIGISVALHECYKEVIVKLNQIDDQIIIDGNMKFDDLIDSGYNIESIVKADTKIPTVMAASILAKTYRDAKVKALHNDFPQYGFQNNVGYGSKKHLEAIAKHGPCLIHRMSYAPMKNMKNGISS